MGVSHVSPSAMIGAAMHVEHEYGMSGYRVGIVAAGLGGEGEFEVTASDGSRFELIADRFGNVFRPEHTRDGGDNR